MAFDKQWLDHLKNRLEDLGTLWLTAAIDLKHRWQAPRMQPDLTLAATRPMRHVNAFVALLLCLLVVVCALYLDESVARGAVLLPGFVRGTFGEITKLGESGWIFVLCALVAGTSLAFTTSAKTRLNTGLRLLAARATFIFVLIAGSGILSQVLKHIIGRARPKYMDIVGPFHFDWLSLGASTASMPSGHSITAFAIFSAMAVFWPSRKGIFATLAVLVALSRVIIDAHFVSDVVAGSALGYASMVVFRRMCAQRRLVFRPGPRDRFGVATLPRLRGQRALAYVLGVVQERLERSLSLLRKG